MKLRHEMPCHSAAAAADGGVPVPYPAAKSGSSCEGIIAHSSCVAPDNRNGGEEGEMERYMNSENNLWNCRDSL